MSGNHSSNSHDLGHIIPRKTYVTVLITLLFLTLITVAVSRVDFGVMNIVVALVIASIKAGIVGLFFMHLKYEHPAIWVFVAFPLILLVIMIGGVFLDNPNRRDHSIYFEAPKAVEEHSNH